MPIARAWPGLPLVAVVASFAPTASAVSFEWVAIEDAGNACDQRSQGCFGGVDYAYQIARYEVTNVQYAEFLNAVAASDPNLLWDHHMEEEVQGGILRAGSSGSYSYGVKPGFEEKPVNYVSLYDAFRFVNWLNNGQPSGTQNASTTEDGTYTITDRGILDNSIARNPGASFFLTSEDEWYKAAYYDPASQGWFDLPTGANPVTCGPPAATPDTANCENAAGGVTEVGSYPGSPSVLGTFDQGGNVYEWTEAAVRVNQGLEGNTRVVRGGSWKSSRGALHRNTRFDVGPQSHHDAWGFRVATVPEPGSGALLAVGLGIVGLARRRRSRGPSSTSPATRMGSSVARGTWSDPR